MEAAGMSGTKKIFGFYLSNQQDGDNGEFTFGGINEKRFTGPITYCKCTFL
jgi:hypothetical protein